MTAYQLAPTAIADLDEILLNRSKHLGEESATRLEEDLLSAFERLATTPGLGHRRSDLTQKPYYFYLVDPYIIVYARHVDPLPILAVLHAARNVRAVLAKRKQ